MRNGISVFGVVTLACATLLAPAAGARARPDLVVSKGSVTVAQGRATGSFTVRNGGSARSGPSTASLVVKAARRYRAVRHFTVTALSPGASEKVRVSAKLPGGLPAGSRPLLVCADSAKRVSERSEGNNCRRVGTARIGGKVTHPSSRPTKPIAFQKDTVLSLADAQSEYWVDVPDAYDASHRTPITLFVWMHGCGGEGSGDIYTISPGGSQSYIAISIGGREDQCWNPKADVPKVLAAIADVKTHFNINPRRVVIGGYSSGGYLAYRTAFYHSTMFAGLLAENTAAFKGTGSTQAASIAAATFRFHIVHLAHTEDDQFPVAGAVRDAAALRAAGFPVTLIQRPGTHYDDSTATTGTDHDLRALLLPHLKDHWLAP